MNRPTQVDTGASDSGNVGTSLLEPERLNTCYDRQLGRSL